jgi:hypothetical protein
VSASDLVTQTLTKIDAVPTCRRPFGLRLDPCVAQFHSLGTSDLRQSADPRRG